MSFISIGFGNLINMDRVLVLTGPESSPIKRLIQDARERGVLIDASSGRKTRAVLVLDSDHVVLSSLAPDDILRRSHESVEGVKDV